MERFEAKVHSLVHLEMAILFERLATVVNVACVNGGWVGCLLVIMDHPSVCGSLAKLAAINATRELTFPVVVVHVLAQRTVG